MKEVKLKINVSKIVQSCKLINTEESDVRIKSNEPVEYLAILKSIISESLEIESSTCSKKEKEDVLNTIKNNIYRYFAYNDYRRPDVMHNLHFALSIRDTATIEYETIRLLNELIMPNPFIYNPNHGIRRKNANKERPENITLFSKIPDSLCTRAYTLEIDDRNSSSLESMLHFASESLDRENFRDISNSLNLRNIKFLKEYSSIEELYSLDKLYATPYKDTCVPLVDYGLKLIHTNYNEILDLMKMIREIKYSDANNNSPEDIVKKISSLFASEEDLKIVISVGNNLEKINYEKIMQTHIIRVLEYMASSTDLLKEKEGSNTLKINPSLDEFYENYIRNTGFKELVCRKKDKLNEEVERVTDFFIAENIRCSKAKAKLQATNINDLESHEDSVNAIFSVGHLENKMHLLNWELKKEVLVYHSIQELWAMLKAFDNIAPAQQEYIVKKIEEFERMQNTRLVEERKLFSTRPAQEKIAKTLTLAVICMAICALLIAYSRNEVKIVG
ncbi:hypothetical protein NEMIN01_1812 [Nematocida minor]|uniref:uncharacterized protein n=1 Tax=Nematocida minor TaxID=1912983 RepID=UPI0022206F0D|nr:uncharacterized protein NEMIN01_1812 [Nematocida minor]KAI5192116.1 hypothetical protein NEMIN01_1812 [Nematocida minor]